MQMTVSVPASASRTAKLSAARVEKRASKSALPGISDRATADQQQNQQDDDTADAKGQQRWYMGEYGEANGKTTLHLLYAHVYTGWTKKVSHYQIIKKSY